MNTTSRTLMTVVTFLVAASSACADEAVLQSMLGQVSVKISAAAAAIRARPGMTLPQGSEVATGANSRCVIRFNTTDVVRLGPTTTLQVSTVSQGTATSHDTVLRLVVGSVRAMLSRAAAKRKMNFAIAAGAAVCAVKGTEYDVIFPDPSKPVDVVVSNGAVSVVTALPNMAAVLEAIHQMGVGVGGTAIPAGFRVHIDNDGHVSRPTPAPVRTTLEVTSITGGKVLATVGGVTTEVHAGEEIPAGASVQVVGGEAVLSSPGESVSAGDGAVFTFNANSTTGGGITSSIAPAAGSTPVQVEVGHNVATVTAGSTLEVAASGTSAPTMSAQGGSITITNASGGQVTLTEGQTISTAVVTAADVNGQQTSTSDFQLLTGGGVTVVLPPDTTNQNLSVISPSAP